MPTSRCGEEIGHGVPADLRAYAKHHFSVTCRSLLESRILHAIEIKHVAASDVSAYVYLAPNAIDYSGYPDCRPEFYENMRRTLELGSKLWTQYGVSIKVETPIIDLSKAEIATLGIQDRGPTGAHLELLPWRRSSLRFV